MGARGLLPQEHTALQQDLEVTRQQNAVLQSRQSVGPVRKAVLLENFDALLKVPPPGCGLVAGGLRAWR